jgi:hypothetical protein
MMSPVDVPTWRLHLLRAMYLLIVVGLGCVIWPGFFNRTHPWVLMNGVVSCMLVAFSLLALVGLRHPLRMLPILLWELTWKTVWLAAIAAPLAARGQMDEATLGTVIDCSLVVLVALVIPWRYVLHHYVRQRGDRWGAAQ